MAQQSMAGKCLGVAHPVPYAPAEEPDLTPSDSQPPGVDEDIDLEEALTSL